MCFSGVDYCKNVRCGAWRYNGARGVKDVEPQSQSEAQNPSLDGVGMRGMKSVKTLGRPLQQFNSCREIVNE